MTGTSFRIAVGLGVIILLASASQAGVVVYEKGDKKIELGARVHIQYEREDPDGGEATDDLFFRRLRPYIQGTTTENWFAKVQFDFGTAQDADEVSIKDAYIRYTGLKRGRITFGNQKPGFSRQFLASSNYQQVVSRGFAGDHNFGSPDRAIVVKYDGHTEDKELTYSVAAGMANHDPNAGRMDFDTPTNNRADWNEGGLLVGRVDFHPLGFIKFNRGDFGRTDPKFNVSVAGFYWANDDDNNTLTDPATGLSTSATAADLDEANGLEVSGGYRGQGWSADAEYQMISGDTVDTSFTGGAYLNGTTDLDILSVNGGYMVIDGKLEVAAAWDSIDADGYATAWTRTTLGLNLFVNEHKAKLQVNYRMDENEFGVRNDDVQRIQLQAQFVF